jgi:CO/xanthine dehydrogenase Mo-binding subunit
VERGKYIGASVRSKEAPRHVAGRGRFVDDLALPRMLHAFVLRSPYAHARIASVNGEKAAELPGVCGVLTPADVTRMSRPFKPGRYAAGLRVPIPEYACAVDKARYAGEPVAMVAAETRPKAEDALDAIEAEYEPLPAIVTTDDATSASAPLIYDELGSNVAWQGQVAYGDVDRAFAGADTIIRENLKIHRYSSSTPRSG